MKRILTRTNFHILYLISFSHLINDLIQGVIPSVYPLLKEKYELSFIQIGLITFAFQFTASILQPLVGHYTDKKPKIYAQIYGLILSAFGVVFLSYANGFNSLILSCILIGIASAIFHPESSRIANLASGGKIGVAQSIFQVGGNLGTAIAPLLVALIVLPNSQVLIVLFVIPLVIGFFVLREVATWYKKHLSNINLKKSVIPKSNITFSRRKIKLIIGILLVIIFSKFIYAASLSNYYSFYLIEKFDLTIEQSQIHLFIYLFSYMLGTVIGGPLGDKYGRLYVIWFSVLGATPFILMLPYVNLFYTDMFMIVIGLIMASAFPAIMSYAQELLPNKLGVISGMFYGFAFGVAAIGSALIGILADNTSIDFVYKICSFLPLVGIVCLFLPNLNLKKVALLTNYSLKR
ncbi:MFS transporter [Flavobacteriaceae bacterium S0825]|uniref:MFS transporter n=1 Tax=Gaetbulibacter sp. S0825 TaxID=2720084 RepID=UPI0014314798|nr:MFS transporter [Gaetbulibacter sp. S0825]MCK0107882.1 MFS transporter [Flavobacteriaceae bacterium S0825]NIX63518.1 MFS transporter [Gaetbulibacter sp. S0825]